MMKISLIIPCIPVDLEPLLHVLDSVLNGQELPDEILVVLSDSDSADPTKIQNVETALQAFSPIDTKLLQRRGQKFAGDNRNFGCTAGRHQLLMCHDADDPMHPQKVKLLKCLFEQNPGIDLCNHLLQPHQYEWIDYNDDYIFDSKSLVPVEQLRKTRYAPHKWGRFGGMHCGNVTFRRQVFEQIKFDANMKRGQDRDFIQRALDDGFNCVILRAFLCKYDLIHRLNFTAARMHEWKKCKNVEWQRVK